VVTADKAYDSEDNHLLVREQLGAFSVIPARHKERYPNMEYTWKIQKTNEAWVSKNTIQSKEQR
jgi:hypothetical protein